MSETFERIVEMAGAWDKRDPDPAKNYGIHGMEVRFVLKGDLGATQFVAFLNIHLPHVREELRRKRSPDDRFDLDAPMGADVGYHSPEPCYDGQSIVQESCPYLDGKPCYYDGSGLRADGFMPEFIAGGSDAVWGMLEEEYRFRFTREAA
jgi:hypothetical protein